MDTNNYLPQIEAAVEAAITKAQGKPAPIVATLTSLRGQSWAWWEARAQESGVLIQNTYPGGRYPSLLDALSHGCSVAPMDVVHRVAGFIFKGGR